MFAKFNIDSNNNDKRSLNEIDNKNNIIEHNKNNNNIEDLKSQDELSKLIKDIPLNNLNDYYDIETNLFKKRIEKLNLKFYWIYESVIGDNNNDLLYPYNKLFLILFKELSLYIEEIVRLNKQLNLKNKNEKYYIQRINDYKQKEKDFIQNKQIIKNMERNIKNLEKNNEKLKNELEKVNKKFLNTNALTLSNNSNFVEWKNNLSNRRRIKDIHKDINKNHSININEQGSILSTGSNNMQNRTHMNKKNKSKEIARNINSNSSIYTKTTNISYGNNNKDIIYFGINQCEEEIKNLNLIENLLINCYEIKSPKRKKIQSYKIFSPVKYNNINNPTKITSYRKSLYKSKMKTSESIDNKANNIINAHKI